VLKCRDIWTYERYGRKRKDTKMCDQCKRQKNKREEKKYHNSFIADETIRKLRAITGKDYFFDCFSQYSRSGIIIYTNTIKELL